MNLVLTFSRGYGTGTSIITDELSRRLNVPVYGRDFICRSLQDEENLEEQRAMITKLAQDPCIIVGRGASDVLKDQHNAVNIFVHARRPDRVKRIMQKEGLSEEEASEKITRVDAERKKFYEENTGKFWGDVDAFDIIIDTSRIPIEDCASAIIRYLEHIGDL